MMTTQLEFNFDQAKELARVSGKIGVAVLAFFETLEDGEEFHAKDLHEFVESNFQIAPASADRVMRDLKQKGKLSYAVVNRRDSRYRRLA